MKGLQFIVLLCVTLSRRGGMFYLKSSDTFRWVKAPYYVNYVERFEWNPQTDVFCSMQRWE